MKPVDRWVLPNGLTVLYRHSPGVPLAAAILLLRVGSRDETFAQAGIASLTTDLMLQGTRTRSVRDIADATESVGASLGSQTAEDYTDFGFIAPVAKVDRLLGLLMESIRYPTFPEEEIQKERKHVLASLKSRQDSLFNFAYDHLNKALFGSHPYAYPIDGTPPSVKKLKRADFVRWHQRHIHPDRAIFSMVSSLSLREAGKLFEKHLASWKKQERVPIREPRAVWSPQINTLIRKQAAFEQAYYMIGMQAPTVHEPGYIVLKVLNMILGGGMSSRLFLKLREELGLAYEVSSFYPTHLSPSQWVLYLGLPVQKLAMAKKALHALLLGVEQKGVRPDEIRQAATMIKASYLMEHQTRRRQAWYAAWWEFLGKNQDYDRDFLRAIERVKPGEIREWARRLLAQPRVTVEVVPQK